MSLPRPTLRYVLATPGMKRPAAKRVVTRSEAAAYCGLSVSAFDRWVRAGRLPHSLPGTRRWDLQAVDRAIDRTSAIQQPSALERWEAAREGKS